MANVKKSMPGVGTYLQTSLATMTGNASQAIAITIFAQASLKVKYVISMVNAIQICFATQVVILLASDCLIMVRYAQIHSNVRLDQDVPALLSMEPITSSPFLPLNTANSYL
jgi:hypothetical protein